MKTTLTLLALASAAFAQGPLAPPGAPAPTMKTLDEIHAKVAEVGEKRTPISSIPFTITQPGSYYLASNLSTALAVDGISIDAKNVTIDLNGFRMTGFGAGLAAIKVTNTTVNTETLVVKNGTIDGWQTAVGGNSDEILGGTIEGLQIKGGWGIVLNQAKNFTVKECSLDGSASSSPSGVIHIGAQGSVIGCRISNAGGALIAYGIVVGENSQVGNCAVAGAYRAVVAGAQSGISHCSVKSFGTAGVVVGPGSLVEDVSVTNGTGPFSTGIEVTEGAGAVILKCRVSTCVLGIVGGEGVGSRVADCIVTSTSGTGISALHVSGSTVDTAATTGIYVHNNGSAQNCIVIRSNIGIGCNDDSQINGNSCTLNYHGIFIYGARCTIRDNSVNRCVEGIRLEGSSNTVTRNTFRGFLPNTAIYIVPGQLNDIGPIGTAAASTSPFANISN